MIDDHRPNGTILGEAVLNASSEPSFTAGEPADLVELENDLMPVAGKEVAFSAWTLQCDPCSDC